MSLALGLVLICSCPAFAAPGDPDRSFGRAGVVDPGLLGRAHIGDLVPVDGGSVVVGGDSGADSGLLSWEVLRFGRDGRLRGRFGSAAFARRLRELDVGTPEAVATDSGGRLVVAGRHYDPPAQIGWAVVRYLPSGEADASFGENGVAIFDFAGMSDASPLAVAPDGRDGYLVGGFRGRAGDPPVREGLVGRLSADGLLDAEFGEDGFFSFGQDSTVLALVRDAQRGVIVAGNRRPFDVSSRGFVGRFGPDGQLEAEFGAAAREGLGGRMTFSGVAISGDQSVLVGSVARPYAPAVARLNADGSLDGDFGDGGVASIPRGAFANSALSAVAVDGAQRILAVGRSARERGGTRPWVVRLKRSGALDGGFAGNGSTRLAVPVDDASANAITLAPNGRLLIGGAGGGFRDESAFIAQLFGGAPDSTPPRLNVRAARRGGVRSVLVCLRCDEDCAVRISGQVRGAERSVALKSRTLTLQRGRAKWVRLRTRDELPKRTMRVVVKVKATDSAGNAALRRAALRFER